MKRINLINARVIFFVAIFFSTLNSFAQAIKPLSGIANWHIITSGSNHKTYKLYVSLPKTYSDADSLRYPVLYVLDGKYSFTSFYSIRGVLDLDKEIKDI